jgi:hypothetical protein
VSASQIKFTNFYNALGIVINTKCQFCYTEKNIKYYNNKDSQTEAIKGLVQNKVEKYRITNVSALHVSINFPTSKLITAKLVKNQQIYRIPTKSPHKCSINCTNVISLHVFVTI